MYSKQGQQLSTDFILYLITLADTLRNLGKKFSLI